MIGQKKYDEEMEILQKIKKDEELKGEFLAIDGDVDQRDKALLDVNLQNGFQTHCGIKGGKLSGGQK